MAVGIFDKDPEYNMQNLFDFYDKMYNDSEEDFARKEFNDDLEPVTYSNDEFAIEASMDAAHACNISITVGSQIFS